MIPNQSKNRIIRKVAEMLPETEKTKQLTDELKVLFLTLYEKNLNEEEKYLIKLEEETKFSLLKKSTNFPIVRFKDENRKCTNQCYSVKYNILLGGKFLFNFINGEALKERDLEGYEKLKNITENILDNIESKEVKLIALEKLLSDPHITIEHLKQNYKLLHEANKLNN